MLDQTILKNEPMISQMQEHLPPNLFIILNMRNSALTGAASATTSSLGVWYLSVSLQPYSNDESHVSCTVQKY